MEVDEIFDEVTLSRQDENAVPDDSDPGGHSLLSLSEDGVSHESNLKFSTNSGFAGQGQLHLAAPLEKTDGQPAAAQKLPYAQEAKGNRPKQFYLKGGQKKRWDGPYSASEIAAMFLGKSFPSGIKVVRMGLDLKKPKGEVPLARFMRIYSSHQDSKLRSQSDNRRQHQPTSELAKLARAEERIAKDRAVFLALLAMIMFIAAILVIAFSVVHQTSVNPKTGPRITDKKATKIPSKQPIERVRKATNPPISPKQDNTRSPDPLRALGSTRDSAQTIRDKIIREKLLASQKEQERKTKLLAKIKAREETKREEAKREEAKREAERTKPKPPEPPPSSVVISTPQPATPKPVTPATPAPISVPAPVPKPVPAPVPKPTVLADGMTAQRYGPLACSKVAISSCDGSCTVPCSGPQGTVTIMFFKGVWGAKIEAKAASLYVSGFVRAEQGSGPRIIVSDVQ